MTTISIKPTLERWRFWRTRLGQWLKSYFGIGRRYGLRYHRGNSERSGFLYKREALNWAREHCPGDFALYFYEPLDMRLQPSAEYQAARYSGAPGAES